MKGCDRTMASFVVDLFQWNLVMHGKLIGSTHSISAGNLTELETMYRLMSIFCAFELG